MWKYLKNGEKQSKRGIEKNEKKVTQNGVS